MGDMIYLAAGYAVFWLVTFVFIYSLVSRQRKLQRDLELLEKLAKEEPEVEQQAV